MEKALRIDRGLCSAGMRLRGAGRSIPDMTRREALTFLLACMTTEKVTQVADEVLGWLNARGVPNPLPTFSRKDDWDDSLEDTDRYKHYIEVNGLLGISDKESATVLLIDYLEAVCRLVETDKVDLDSLVLEVDFSDRLVRVHYERRDYVGLEESSEFSIATQSSSDDLARRACSSGIKRTCKVSGRTFYEIVKRT